jgi:hypothetical protein
MDSHIICQQPQNGNPLLRLGRLLLRGTFAVHAIASFASDKNYLNTVGRRAGEGRKLIK